MGLTRVKQNHTGLCIAGVSLFPHCTLLGMSSEWQPSAAQTYSALTFYSQQGETKWQ